MSEFKEVTITEDAIPKVGGRRRRGTRKARQDGGDNSGALLQLTAQSAPAGSVDPTAQSLAAQMQGQVKNILTGNFGPNKQWGGDNAGALMQLVASNPRNRQYGGDNSGALMQLDAQSVGKMGTPNINALAAQSRAMLEQSFGPDRQWGGKKQRGGDVVASGVVLASSRAPTLPGSPPATAVVSGINPEQPAPVGGGRVVLAPPKRKMRISLRQKKRGGSVALGELSNTPPQPGGGHTRKARKIHLRVKGVTSRLAKAKKAKKTADAAPLSEVKHKLEAAKVIKKGSKAPESMLRTMYADLLITKKGL